MSQGSHVPNFKALGAPKSKWQPHTHRQTHAEPAVQGEGFKIETFTKKKKRARARQLTPQGMDQKQKTFFWPIVLI